MVSEETEDEDEEMKELMEPDWPVEKKVWRDASGQPLIRSSLEWNRWMRSEAPAWVLETYLDANREVIPREDDLAGKIILLKDHCR